MLEKRISDKIRQVRTTRGITLAKIAQGLGVPISVLCKDMGGGLTKEAQQARTEI